MDGRRRRAGGHLRRRRRGARSRRHAPQRPGRAAGCPGPRRWPWRWCGSRPADASGRDVVSLPSVAGRLGGLPLHVAVAVPHAAGRAGRHAVRRSSRRRDQVAALSARDAAPRQPAPERGRGRADPASMPPVAGENRPAAGERALARRPGRPASSSRRAGPCSSPREPAAGRAPLVVPRRCRRPPRRRPAESAADRPALAGVGARWRCLALRATCSVAAPGDPRARRPRPAPGESPTCLPIRCWPRGSSPGGTTVPGDRSGADRGLGIGAGTALVFVELLPGRALDAGAGRDGSGALRRASPSPLATSCSSSASPVLAWPPAGRRPPAPLFLLAAVGCCSSPTRSQSCPRSTPRAPRPSRTRCASCRSPRSPSPLSTPACGALSGGPPGRHRRRTAACASLVGLATLSRPASSASSRPPESSTAGWAIIVGLGSCCSGLVVGRMVVAIEQIAAGGPGRGQLQARLTLGAAHDALTGLPNRARGVRPRPAGRWRGTAGSGGTTHAPVHRPRRTQGRQRHPRAPQR